MKMNLCRLSWKAMYRDGLYATDGKLMRWGTQTGSRARLKWPKVKVDVARMV